jgi:predicted lipoprotein
MISQVPEMTSKLVDVLSEPAIMMLLGIVSHTLKEVIKQRRKDIQEGKKALTTLKTYLYQRRYSVIVMIIGSLVGFVVLYQMNELTALNAFGLGYIANSIGELAASSAERKVSQ